MMSIVIVRRKQFIINAVNKYRVIKSTTSNYPYGLILFSNMYSSSQSIDHAKLQSYLSLSSPKLKPTTNLIISAIQKLSSQQEVTFQQLNNACTMLQGYITNLQQSFDKLDERISEMNENTPTQTIFNLRNKQNEFIIHQLKDKIKKLQTNQQSYAIEIKHLKKELDAMKRQEKEKMFEISQSQRAKQIYKVREEQLSRYRQNQATMEQLLKSKDVQILQLNRKLSKLNEQKRQEKQFSALTNLQKANKDKEEDYKVLESKLLDLEKEFQVKLSSLYQQVKEKTAIIKGLQAQLTEKQKELDSKCKELAMIKGNSQQESEQLTSAQQQFPSPMTITFHPSRHPLTTSLPGTQSASHYQLQLKLAHQQTLYKQLQQQYNNHLTTANNLEIQLHQQIHLQKTQLQQQKKKHKNQKKNTIQLLQSLASFINKRTFNYFDNNIQNVVQQLKNIFTKEKQKWDKELQQIKKTQQAQKDQITQLQRQIRKLKAENQLSKQEIQTLKDQLQKVQAQRQKQRKAKKQNSSQVSESNQQKKSSLNGSLGEISNATKSQAPSMIEQKYKSMIDLLRQQIEQKQKHITELQNLQAADFQKSKQKILSIESQLADCRNEIKKQQRQIRDLNQKIIEQSKQADKLKLTIHQSNQKLIKQKQAIQTHSEQKQKLLEQKITKLKDQNQQIDSKCQEKVMKYNKLKIKLEKLEMYNSETEKRKDAQIEELIKKNQQVKMECKLLEEKLNITQALQLSTSGTAQDENAIKTTFGYNRELIEQIQVQRDKILQQYENKRREYLKLKQTCDKLQDQQKRLQQRIDRNEQEKQKKQLQKQKLQQQKQSLLSENQRVFTKWSEEKQSLSLEIFDLKKQNDKLKNDNQSLSKQNTKLQQEITNKSKQEYQHMKKQLESQIQLRKKKEKEEQALVERIKELRDENEKIKKDLQQKTKSLETKWMEKFKEKSNSYHQEINKLKDQHNRKVKDMEQKLSQAAIREENLVNIINYKNLTMSGTIRQSMRGDEQDFIDQEIKQMNKQAMENQIEHVEEYNFRVKHKVEMKDQYTSTESRSCFFMLAQMDHLRVQPRIDKKILNLQKLQPISVHTAKRFTDKQSQTNIFQDIFQNYPQIIESIINQNPVENPISNNPLIEKVDIGVNTEHKKKSVIGPSEQGLAEYIQRTNQKDTINILTTPQHKGSSHILDSDLLAGSVELSRSSVQATPITSTQFINIHPIGQRQRFDPQSNRVEQINLFQNLKGQRQLGQQNMEDNFQICQQGESINVGQTALNLQIKQIFNKLRQQLQKVFNGEQISLSMIKILPRQLEDDYNQFISYVKEKILEIKNQNQLSFIMAEVGEAPELLQEELDVELLNFANKKVSEDIFAYKKLVQEKQALITSLMNEKTMQQNTINQMTMQQQQLQQQHENRFMNQCNIYKRQIKQLKNKVDTLEMNFQSLKNIFKNVMEIWVDDIENQDDLRDNFTIYKTIAKLNELDSTRLNYYIFRYKQIKHILD